MKSMTKSLSQREGDKCIWFSWSAQLRAEGLGGFLPTELGQNPKFLLCLPAQHKPYSPFSLAAEQGTAEEPRAEALQLFLREQLKMCIRRPGLMRGTN